MNKQIWAVVAIIASLIGFLFLVYTFTNRPQPKINVTFNQKATTYFYGTTCPNCKQLNAWIEENDIEKKVKYVKREVYYNRENAAMLEQAALVCQIPNNEIGVPLIFHKGKCYLGVPDAQKILTELSKKGK